MVKKDPESLGYASREERYTPVYGLLLIVCPILLVLLLQAAEVNYMRSQSVVVPPLPATARWLLRAQVAIILVSSVVNLILAPWHLKYLSSYRRATAVKRLVSVGLFSFVVLAVHFCVLYMVAMVNAV